MKHRILFLVLLGGVCFSSFSVYGDLSEKAKAKIEAHFNLESWEADSKAHGEEIIDVMKKEGALSKLTRAEKQAFLRLIRNVAEEKQQPQVITEQLIQDGADHQDREPSSGCPNFLKGLLSSSFEAPVKNAATTEPTKKVKGEAAKRSFRQRTQERLKATATALRIATGKTKTNLRGLRDFFNTSCKPLLDRYEGDCAQENPCAPSPSKFTGVDRLKTAMRVLTSSQVKVPEAQTLDSCVLEKFLEEGRSHLEGLDYANMKMTDFKQLRDYYLQILDLLNKPENQALKKTYSLQIQELLAAYDPYGPFGRTEDLIEKLCRITSDPNEPEPHDVRSLVLIDDTLNNLGIQKRINSLLSMSDRLEDSSFDIKKLGCFVDSEKDDRKNQNSALKTLTYLGNRTKDYPSLNEGLQKKLGTLVHLGYSRERRPRGDSSEETVKYAPQFTAGEAWLIDHQVTAYQFVASNLLKSPILEMPTAVELKDSIQKKVEFQRKALQELKKATFTNYQPGDIILQSIERQAEYKGEKLKGDYLKQRVFTRADVQHAGLFLAGNSPTILHSMDSDLNKHGVKMHDLDFGEEYYSSGFRFNLLKLLNPELVQALEKQKPNAQAWLKEKLIEFNEQYQKQIEKDFDKNDPKYQITNHLTARNLSAIPRAFHGLFVKLMKKKTEDEPNKQEIDRAVSIMESKRTEDKAKEELALRVEQKRRNTPMGSFSDPTHEICSEFAFTEAIRYLIFINQQLSQETRRIFAGDPLNLPEMEVEFSKLHTGTLYRMMLDLEKRGVVSRVLPPPGLFATQK